MHAVRHALKAERIAATRCRSTASNAPAIGRGRHPRPGADPAHRREAEDPVIASGGFGDARGLVAALALGADGINMGTRFMATQEAPIHASIKEKLVASDERQTALISAPCATRRGCTRTSIADKGDRDRAQARRDLPGRAGLRRRSEGPSRTEAGELDHGIWSAGMVQA